MTDPNVLKALKELADAVAWSVPSGLDDNLVKARRCLDRAFTLLAAAEKPAEAAPALPWVVRQKSGEVVAQFRYWHDAVDFAGDTGQREVVPAAAPTVAAVVPVKFNDDGDAMLPGSEFHRQSWGSEGAGTGWLARIFHAPSSTPGMRIRLVDVMLPLRPGEDAGETVAKMLAAVGRGP